MAALPPEITPPALPAVPVDPGLPAHLEGYARGAKAKATQRAYAADWRHYTAWCERKDLAPLPPDPQVVGLYLAACAAAPALPGQKPGSVDASKSKCS